MLLRLPKMASTRFLSGVHSSEDCRSNKKGYAAIAAASPSVDLHNLDSYPSNASYQEHKNRRKRSISSYDAMAYTMLKILSLGVHIQVFVILLSKDSSLHGAPQEIVNTISSAGTIVVTIVNNPDEYEINLFYQGIRCTDYVIRLNEIKYMLDTIKPHGRMVIMVYPILSSDWVDIINYISPNLWCIPSCRLSRWTSVETISCCHFIYPWSRHPSFSGYTIGNGKMRECTREEYTSYIGKSNFYSNMISCVPLGSSCVDCEAMKDMGSTFSKMTSNHKRTSSRSRPLSLDAIHALDDIEKMMREISSGSDKSDSDNVAP